MIQISSKLVKPNVDTSYRIRDFADEIKIKSTPLVNRLKNLYGCMSKLLRIITGAPWYISNSNLHKYLNIPTIRDEIKNSTTSYTRRLAEDPNPLALAITTMNIF